MRFAGWVFIGAAIYGFVTLAPMCFLEGMVGRQSGPVSHPEYFYGFVGVGLAFQVLFWIIGRDPVRLRPAMVAGVLEKISFGAAVLALIAQGRADPRLAGFAIIDLILAVLFAMAWLRTKDA